MEFLGLSFLIVLVFVPACIAPTPTRTEFTYKGETGPEKWASLSASFQNCGSGKSQSPINIITSQATPNASLPPISTSYQSAAAVLVNNKFNVEVGFTEVGGTLNIDGKDHTLKQFHLHVPSEHHIDGKQFAAELHIVHISNDGSLAVLAILYKLGHHDKFISQIEEGLKKIADDPMAEVPIGSIDVSTILPNVDSFYRYTGSLTTPPCTEGVTWSVLSHVKTISLKQITAIMAALAEDNKSNNRPVQPLNGRQVQRPSHS